MQTNTFTATISILAASFIAGCATAPPPLVRISKSPPSETCVLTLAISNRYPNDIQGNYLDIALLDKAGAIVDRINGAFNNQLFQSGYTRTIPLKTRANCAAIEGIKVYTLSFARPSTGRFAGDSKYKLELQGFTLSPGK